MSVSIYYSFRHESDLWKSGALDSLSNDWLRAFGGKPYEPWTWYEAERKGELFEFQGATKLPNSASKAWAAVQVAAALLTSLRNAVGGTEWSVAVDDHVMPWRETLNEFDPS
jgi:hypothetical protein